jgi:hypothetical protein
MRPRDVWIHDKDAISNVALHGTRAITCIRRWWI